jgi:hypothetical protein
VHKHRTRIDELLDLELLQRAQKPTRAVDGDGLIEGVLLAGEIEVGNRWITLAMCEPNRSRNLRNANSIEASDVKST